VQRSPQFWLEALDAETGETLWRRRLALTDQAFMGNASYAATTWKRGDRTLGAIACENRLLGFDLLSGQPAWPDRELDADPPHAGTSQRKRVEMPRVTCCCGRRPPRKAPSRWRQRIRRDVLRKRTNYGKSQQGAQKWLEAFPVGGHFHAISSSRRSATANPAPTWASGHAISPVTDDPPNP